MSRMFAGSPLTFSTSTGSPLSSPHKPTASGSSLEDSLALAPSPTSNSNLLTHNPSRTHVSNSGSHSPSTPRASGSPFLRNSLVSSPAGSSLKAGQSRSALLAARGSCPSSSDAAQVGDHTFPSSGSLLDLSVARAPFLPTSSFSRSIPPAPRLNEAGTQLTRSGSRLPGSSVDEGFNQNCPVRFSAEGAPLEIALDENPLKNLESYSTVDQGSGFEIDSTPQNREARGHVDAGSDPPANQVESLSSVPAAISDSHSFLFSPCSGAELPSGCSSAGARNDQVETPSLPSPVSQSSSASFFPTMGSSSVSLPSSALPAREAGGSLPGSSRVSTARAVPARNVGGRRVRPSRRFIEDYFGGDGNRPSTPPGLPLASRGGINPKAYHRYKKIPTPRVVTLNLQGISAGHTVTARRKLVRKALRFLARNADVILLQETNTSLASFGSLCLVPGFTEYVNPDRTAILLRDSFADTFDVDHFVVCDGHIHGIQLTPKSDLSLFTSSLAVINVYLKAGSSPMDFATRRSQITALRQLRNSADFLIIGGDWNLVTSPGDTATGSHYASGPRDVESLLKALDHLKVAEVYQSSFTRFSDKDTPEGSRLDRIYISHTPAHNAIMRP